MLDKPAFPDLYDILGINPGDAAAVIGEAGYARAEFLCAAEIAESFLRNNGFKAGDVLCSWLPDSAAWLQLLLACVKVGVLLVPISSRCRHDEARRILKTSRAKGVVVPASLLETDDLDVAEALAEGLPLLSFVVGVDVATGFLAASSDIEPKALPATAARSLCDFSVAA